MTLIRHGTIQNGAIVFPDRLPLPDATAVTVVIQPSTPAAFVQPSASATFAGLGFFGMWADRRDIDDSAAWVRKERQQWQHRPARAD